MNWRAMACFSPGLDRAPCARRNICRQTARSQTRTRIRNNRSAVRCRPIALFKISAECGKLIQRFHRSGGFGLVALVGVQSNQYPRALDIARPFRAAGIPVALGGFHVSGCISMLDGNAIDLGLARELGISMFAGEAEDRLD